MKGFNLKTAFAALAICGAVPVHAAVTPELQKIIRAETFEVVTKKPDKDLVTYEKPLPLDLLPFIERTDAYRSVGTAFALGHNTYVTAAHVLAVSIGSQYGAPALRRPDGTVLAIDRILKFSQHEDFVVFSLLNDPASAGFAVNRNPKIDDPVLAVGNALGEGIVIRDGLFTSETPEDQDGLWKWIRFSAAASPGNSGGPLLDGDGKVIGIVIGKSPNENLNYSLPIGRVLDADNLKARFDQRVLTGLPFLHGTYTYAYKDDFSLPLTWPAFVTAVQALTAHHSDAARAGLLRTYADSLFPKGAGSEALLYEPDANPSRPRLIIQQADGSWNGLEPGYAATDLPADGAVSVAQSPAGALLRLVRSNAAADDAFYADSKAFMELALKALNLRRTVGPDQVRVVSLGAAQTDSVFVDPYGRKWQQRTWAVPFLDSYLVGLLLPTPDGYAAIIQYAPSPALHQLEDQIRLLAGQADVSYTGTLTQWQAYLRRRSLLPEAFNEVKIEPSPVWSLRTRRFVSSVPSAVLALNDKSRLSLTMGFMNDRARVIWDIEEVWWDRDDRLSAAVGLWRRERPPASARLELRNKFATMRDHRSPYDGQLSRETAEVFAASRVLEVPGKKAGTVASDLLYGVTLRMDHYPTPGDSEQSLQKITAATQLLEAGIGDDMPAASSTGSSANSALEDYGQKMLVAAEQADATVGKDIRGRRMSEDLRDYLLTLKTESSKLPLGRADAADSWMEEQRQHMKALEDYWKQYPALTHNRDMWSEFLSRNRQPADTARDPAVISALSALLTVLKSGVPTAEWGERASQLKYAYIAERNRVVRRMGPLTANYSPRVSPCPAPASGTSGTKYPKLGRLTRSLEDFYPALSRRLGEEGTVMVSFRISATGCVESAAIVGSSGSDLLDEAVLKFYETMEFVPGAMDGKAVESTVTAPIVFKLDN